MRFVGYVVRDARMATRAGGALQTMIWLRWGSKRTLLPAALGLVLLAAVAVGMRPILAPDTTYPTQVALDRATILDRSDRRVRVWIADGTCAGSDETPASRYSHADVKLQRFAFELHARMRTERGTTTDSICAGVGAPAFPVRIALPVPLGDRALVSSVGRHAPKLVLLLPRRRGVTRIFAPPEYFYDGEDCKNARRFFRGTISEWCAKFF